MKTITFKRNLAIGLLILFAGVFGAPSNGLANLNDGLVGCWNFDECSGSIVHDCSGNGNDGIISGAMWDTNGISGCALEIVETNIVHYIPSTYDDSITSALTVTAWIKWYGPNTDLRGSYIFDGRGYEYPLGFLFNVSPDSTLNFTLRQGSGSAIKSKSHVHPNTSCWTHVAVVFDDDTDILRLFINGEQDTTVTTTAQYYNSDADLAIGNNRWEDDQYSPLNGLIDEARIYNRALSADEMQMLYNAGTGLVGYWNFDECSGDTVHDHSGHDNHGTIDGASWTTGVSGCALEIVGTNIVHYIPSNYDDSITSTLTVTAWIKWYGPNTYLRGNYIFDGRGYEYPLGFLFNVSPDSTLNFTLRQGSGSAIQSISHVPADTSWTHVAVVFDDDSDILRLFINGKQDTTVTTTATYFNSNAPLAIGNNRWEDGQYAPLNGVIDEARIYNRALSADEIETLYCGRSYIPRGDANGDGEINLGDVVYLITYLYKGGPSPDPLPVGDANWDCVVDMGDVVCLINYLYKSGPLPCCDGSIVPYSGLVQNLNKAARAASVGLGQMKRGKDGVFEIPLAGAIDVDAAGLQFEISFDPKAVTLLEPALTSRTEGLQVFSNTKDGNQRIGIVDLSGQNYVPTGESPLIVLRGRGTDLNSIKIKEAILVDKDANKIPVEIVGEMKKGEESSDVKESIVPKDFSLSQNLPNPFNPQTEISYDLPNACHVTLSIYNLLGQKTRTLVDEYQTTGHKTIRWDGRDDQGIQVASGIYFYQIQAGDFTDAKKMILMK